MSENGSSLSVSRRASLHVVYVDADATATGAFASRFSKSEAGLGVTPVTDVDGCLAALTGRHVDCVVVNAADGGPDASVVERIRDDRPDVPVVVLAGHGAHATANGALAAGAAEVILSDPAQVSSDVLLHRVRSVLSPADAASQFGPAESRGRAGQSPSEVVPRTGRRDAVDAELERYARMVETVPDGVYTLDREFRFTAVNQGMVSLTGYAREELIGMHASNLLGDQDLGAAADRRELLLANPGRVLTAQYDVHTAADEVVPCEVRFTAFKSEGEYRGTAGVMRDVTERIERERELARQRDELDALDRLNAVIRGIDTVLVDAETREAVERAVCERLTAADAYELAWFADVAAGEGGDVEVTPSTWAGVDVDRLAALRAREGGEDDPIARAAETRSVQTELASPRDPAVIADEWPDEDEFWSCVAVPLPSGAALHGVLVVYANRPHAFDEREVQILGEFGETIAYALTAIARTERELTLTTLHGSTRELLHAETGEVVGRILVDAATDDLHLPAAAVYLFDGDDNELRPVATAGVDSDLPSLAPGTDSAVWTAFVSGESGVTDDGAGAGATPDANAMVVPLADHGVLVVARRDAADDMRDLVDLLAATGEAALDRVENEAEIRDRDAVLRERNRSLSRLNRIHEILRRVDRGIVRASTREEIEHVVCERLAESDLFRFAWIGGTDAVGGLAPRAWDGSGRGYLDAVSLSEADGDEPAVRTARTGEAAVVSNVSDDIRGAQWRRAALARGFRSVMSVPLTYGEYRYGVLAVYTAGPATLGEMEGAVLEELGETVAYGINAAETKRALLTDRTVELEFAFPESEAFLARLSHETGAVVEFDGFAPAADERQFFFTATGADRDELAAFLDASVAVDSFRLVAHGGDQCRFEVVHSGESVVSTLAKYGGASRHVVAEDGELTVHVDLPYGADVRAYVEVVQSTYPGATFVARRVRDQRRSSGLDLRTNLGELLTQRQLEVLQTAFLSGYFETPREATGVEIAERLGVSQPTVNKHLRSSLHRLVSYAFAEEDG